MELLFSEDARVRPVTTIGVGTGLPTVDETSTQAGLDIEKTTPRSASERHVQMMEAVNRLGDSATASASASKDFQGRFLDIFRSGVAAMSQPQPIPQDAAETIARSPSFAASPTVAGQGNATLIDIEARKVRLAETQAKMSAFSTFRIAQESGDDITVDFIIDQFPDFAKYKKARN